MRDSRRPLVFADEIFEEFHYTQDATSVNMANDVFITAGRPFIPGQNWRVYVDEGVTLGSVLTNDSFTPTPAVRTGVFPRILHVVVAGSIRGAGGNGGEGQTETDAKAGGKSGGGGGGAGVPPGLGGNAQADATPGDAGSLNNRSDGGIGATPVITDPVLTGSGGKPGSGALYLDMDIRLTTIDNGKIWSGGGGGGGGKSSGVAQIPYRRSGGYGGQAGERGGIGANGLETVRYAPTNTGFGGGLAGITIQANGAIFGSGATNIYTVTFISIVGGSIRGFGLNI